MVGDVHDCFRAVICQATSAFSMQTPRANDCAEEAARTSVAVAAVDHHLPGQAEQLPEGAESLAQAQPEMKAAGVAVSIEDRHAGGHTFEAAQEAPVQAVSALVPRRRPSDAPRGVPSAGRAGGGGVPWYNIEAACRALAAVREARLSDTTGPEATKHCLESENQAYEKIEQEWSQFTAGDRSLCVGVSRQGLVHPVYTELATCLEMIRDNREAKR